MSRAFLQENVVAEFEAQTHARLEPVIHAAAEVDAVRVPAAKEAGVTAGDKRRDLFGFARFQKVVGAIDGKDAKPIAKGFKWGDVTDFNPDACSVFEHAFSAAANVQRSSAATGSATWRGKDVTITVSILIRRLFCFWRSGLCRSRERQ